MVQKTMILSFLRMQESPIHADYEIPAYAGMTWKLTFYECINIKNKKLSMSSRLNKEEIDYLMGCPLNDEVFGWGLDSGIIVKGW